MTNMIQNFISDESGAVTVDWVVLTAALVGLGLAVMAVVSGGVESMTGQIDDVLQTTVDTSFTTPSSSTPTP